MDNGQFYILFLVSPFLPILVIKRLKAENIRADEDFEIVCTTPAQVDQL